MKTPTKTTADQVARKNLPVDAKTIIADARNDITIPYYSNVLRPTDDTIIQRGGSKGLALYDEILRDPFAYSVIQKRIKALVSREWEVKPGGEDKIDLDAAEFVKAQFNAISFDRICEDLSDATLKGFATSEVVWKRDGDRIVVDQIISHDQRRFVFDETWKPRLLTLNNLNDGIELPDRKFITHRFGVKGNNPYGLGLGTRLFWPVLFKREGVAFWLHFLDKFAGPSVIGKIPYGLSPEQEIKLLQMLADIKTSAAAVVPMGTDVSFLEASRSGSVSYEDWCRYWDAQISICVLGETLTTDTQGVGSQALGNVHADMLDMLVDADGDLLSTTLYETLIQWLVDYNYPGAKLPQVWRTRASDEKAEAETSQAKSKAAKDHDEALRQVVATSAKFTDDDDAREYIQAFAPDDLEADMIDRLVTARHAFAAAPIGHNGGPALEDDPKKKEPPRYDVNGNVITANFADTDPEDEIQKTLADKLSGLGDAWDEGHIAVFKKIVDGATSLEDAAKASLKIFADMKPDAYAGTLALAMNAASYAGRDALLQEMASDDEADFAEVSFADVEAFNKPFKEQIEFFKQKAPRPTKAWTDVLKGDHDRAFTIAGAKNRDMLTDFQKSIGDAIKNGTTLKQFQDDFDQIVAKYGWTYKGERGWRTKTIFEHNIRSSYMAGRLKQMRDPAVLKMRPFWEYRHGVTRSPKIPRTQHLSWDGLVLRHDDPWWQVHFPPNGWGPCSCGVRTLSARDLAKRGKSDADESPATLMEARIDKATGKLAEFPQGVDQGWDYMPGDKWERGLVPSEIDTLAAKSAFSVDEAGSIDDLIAASKPFKAKMLPDDKPDDYYIDAFLKDFGAVRGAAVLFKDKAGDHIPISDELFKRADGSLKLGKRDRKVHAAQLAETIRDPDEIWVGVTLVPIPEDQGGGTETVIDRKYVRIDPKTGLLAVFEMLKGVWSAKTAFAPKKKNSVKTDVNQINKRRQGALIYKRK